ncbi:MAG: hypothetical protein QM831_36880 [Kofleriaceae bacterium]
MKLAVAAVLVACTSSHPASPPDAVPPDSAPAGVALHVTVDGDGSIDPTTVNLAIVWFRDPAVWPARLLEPQQVRITSHSLSWPMTIEAVIPEAPTYDNYYSSPSVGARPGRLVAYIDDNHDDQLDFTPITAAAFSDRLIAYSTGTSIVYYTTVDSFAQSVNIQNVGPTERTIDQPMELLAHTDATQSCNLLADWEPHSAYAATFAGIPLDPNDGGPWDREAASDAPCPGNVAPADATAFSCDAGFYDWHAEAFAQPSAFISSTCGAVSRVCRGGGAEPSPCPCDTGMYQCTMYEGGL